MVQVSRLMARHIAIELCEHCNQRLQKCGGKARYTVSDGQVYRIEVTGDIPETFATFVEGYLAGRKAGKNAPKDEPIYVV